MDRVLINDLIEQHGDNYLECKGCNICSKIQTLIHERTPAEKFKHILVKGLDMTVNDIHFLLDNEVDKEDILKALNISRKNFFQMMKDLGFTKSRQAYEAH